MFMSMYKNIFVNEDWDAGSSQIQGINGEILVFGETAFSSVEQAVSAVGDGNAIVIKVASGKYDGFTVDAVVTGGMISSPTKVVAVDFNGGTMTTADGEVTVADSGFSAEAQLSIINDLNANNAANGTVFVADTVTADTTLLVGMGEADYVVGTDAAAVYAENAEDAAVIVNGVENSSILASRNIYVNTAYDSSTEGWGTTHFSSYNSAYAYATANGANATMIIENGSGTYISNEHKNYKNLNMTVRDGATAYYAGNKLDMTYDVVIEAGANLVTARGKNSTSYTHIKDGGSLTIGSAGSDKKAVFDFGTQANAHSIDVAVLWQGSLNATNAIIKVGDFGFNGAANFTDCEVTVEGIVAFGKGFFNQTLTNTTMNVGGHYLRNDNSYFNPSGTLLNNLTMTNSTINVNDGADGTVSQTVTIKKLTMTGSTVNTEGAVEVTGALNLDSNSSLVADSLTFGSSGKITINILDGFTGGKIIDITGENGLTDDILSKITLNGAADGLSAAIVDGDIFVVDQSAALEFNTEEKNTITDTVVAKDVTVTNSKELAVTGGINALDSATITNAKDGETEGKLNGGYDAEGKELAAEITAENTIVLQNDGHANVDLDAKTIIIANNSENTLIGNIGTADTENVIIADGEATADGVTIDGNGVVDGAIKNATITAANIEIGGQNVSDTTINGYTEIISDSSFTDVATSGIVSVGYKNENAADTTLTLAGDTDITALYVGKEGRENEYKAVISGEDTEVTLGNLYSRTDSVVEVTDGATANIGYWQSKGSVLIDDATVNHTGVNMYVYNNDSTSVAEIKLTNGATLNSDANYAIYLGNSEGGPAKGNAALILESGSTLNTRNLILHADGTVEEVAGAAAKTSVSVTDSTLIVTGTMTNNGTFTVSGESTLKIANLSGDADITDAELQDGSYITNGNGTIYFNGSNAIDGAVTIGSEIYNYGKLDVQDGATFTNQSGKITYLVGSGASLNVAENATVKVNDLWNNVQGSAVSTIDGTAEISHNAWLRNATINGSLSVENQLAVYSNDAFNVNGELTINGNGSPAGWLIGNPGSSTGAYAGNITVNVTGGTVNVTGNSTGEEIIIQQYGIFNINSNALGKSGTVSVNGIITNKGEVNITDGSMTSNYKITNSGTMNVTDGAVTASSITNTGTISLTVTDEKLASLGGSAYYMVNQTGSGAALDLGINYNGNVYNVGDSITVGDVVYNVVAGDGNDIAIQAQATVLTVDSSIDASNGFNLFKTAKEALAAANANGGAVININKMTANDPQNAEFALTNAGTYTVTGGTGALFTPVVVNGKDVELNFSNAFVTLGKLRGGKDASNVYQHNSVNVTDSVIASTSYGGYGGGWATFYDCAVTIDNSIYGINLNKYSNVQNLPRSAADVKTAIAAGEYTLASGGGYNGQHIGTVGSLEINDSTVFTGFFSVSDRGYADIDNSVIYVCGSLGVGDGTIAKANDSNNSGWASTSAEGFRTGEVATMDITDSIVRNITLNGEGGGLQVGSNSKAGVLNITNSEFDFTAKGETSDYAAVYANGTVNVTDSVFKVGTLNNAGTVTIANSAIEAAEITGSGTFTIGAGNTELQIGSLNQDVYANQNSDEAITLTGNIGTANKFRVYGDATLDGFNVNASYTGLTVSATGQVLTYGDTVISDSTMALNYYQATGSVLLESGSTIRTANINIYDMQEDSDFVVQGNLEACTFIVVNDYYNPGSGSEVIIDKGGVLTGLTQNGNGRFDIQVGNMTVYGTVNGSWSGGGGTAYIGNSGLDASLTVDGADATFVNSGTQNLIVGTDGVLNVVNGATFDWAAKITNKGSISVDAGSNFSAGSIANTGSINSENAGEMVVLSDMTVSGDVKTADLIINAGGSLTAGSITVDNLTLAIGSNLTLTGSGSSVSADFITVTGTISSAEYGLVLQGWTGDLLGKEIRFDANGDGTISANEVFTVQSDITGLSGVNFVSIDGNLYVKDFGAQAVMLFIGDLDGAQAGEKITVNGVTYTVGVDAFGSAADAAAVLGSDGAANISEITVGNGDHITDISANFANVNKLIVPAGVEITDDSQAQFSGNLVISNDGHLDADITASGKVTMSNTSGNTFTGSLTGENVDVTNTATGKVEDAVLSATDVIGGTLRVENLGVIENSVMNSTGKVDLSGAGTYTNVDVNADALYLNGIDFTLDGDSTVNSVYLGSKEAGEVTLNGAAVEYVYGGALDSSGSVVFDGSALAGTAIEDVVSVTLASGSHEFGGADSGKEYYMNDLVLGSADLTWNWTDDDTGEYNIGTPVNNDDAMVKVSNTAADAELNFNQNGEYSLGDFDVSSYDAIANIAAAATLNLKESTDYFADGAQVNVEGVLNLDGAAVSTGIDFNGAGDINVNDSHNFTAAGALDGFNGDLTIAADKVLTLEGANSTSALLHGSGDAVAQADLTLGAAGALDDFTGDVKADGADTVVTLDGANETAATFSGSGTIEMDADQTLTATGALNEVTGKVQVNDSYTLTLEGVNTVQAALTGSGDIAAEADQSFTGNVSAFTGSYNAAANVGVTFTGASTLATDMELNGLGKFTFESQDADVNVTSDASATTLCINDNNITLNSGVFADITGVTGSELIINSGITAGEVTVDALVINGGKSLSADQVTANSTYVYILNPGEQGPAITVNSSSEFGDISVNSWSSAFTTPFTIVDSVTGQTYTDTVVFILGAGAGTGLTVDGLAQEIDGKFVRVYTQDGDLLIGNYNNTSNVVYVNSDWSTVTGTVEKWTVSATGSANDTDRIIGLDASKTLENAVAILRADANGSGTVYVVKGDTYSTPDALMTADNGVNALVIEGKGFTEYDSTQAEIDLGDAVIEGGVVAMESAMSGSLTLKNVSVDGNVIGGAVVSADAGSASDTTSLTLDGGYYMASQITGGSHVTAGTYTVGSSELVIQNTTDEEMVVLGRVVGGSVVAGANAVVNQSSAGVTVDAGNAITIRGDIYAAGSNIGNGTLNVDNTSVTFTGDAANLTFTGRVSGAAYREAIGSVDRNSALVFDDYYTGLMKVGTFKGLVQDFDEIRFVGDTKVTFSRKQTLTADTDLYFDIDGMRSRTNAMFTVNSFGWTYGDTITVDSADMSSNTYKLIDNWSDYSGINFEVAGNSNYILGSLVTDADGASYRVYLDGDVLKMDYTAAENTVIVDSNDTVDLALDSSVRAISVGAGAEVTATGEAGNLQNVSLGNGAVLNLDGNAAFSSMEDANFQVANAGDTATVRTANTSGFVYATDVTIGAGVTVEAGKQVVNGGNVQVDGKLDSDYFYMLDGDATVTGELVANGDAIQVKGGSTLTVTDGGVVNSNTSINVWWDNSSVVVDNGTVDLTSGHIHMWDGAGITMEVSNGSTIGYGSDFIVGNGGEGIVVTVDDSVLEQSVSSTANSTINNGNAVSLSNGSEWNLGSGKLNIVGTGKLTVSSGSVVNGDITGNAADNTLTVDVDGMLNGTLTLGDGNDTLKISGIDANMLNTNGAVSIAKITDASSIENFKINDVDTVLGGAAVQVAGSATAETADDIWASLGKADGNLVVAWGNTATEAGAALDAFDNETRALGTALLADSSDSFTNVMDHEDFSTKKNNGTLA